MREKGRPNRLVHEKSPYLLQHAYNPVDWYPWGEEAFRAAQKGNKPIFLSIGYSTCHWCHVMEEESFSDSKTAEIMNRYFINIKVDREERPDVDAVYMHFVQALTGSGGWPLNVFLTPDLKPFFGGTYFPPEPRFGRPSFSQLLQAVASQWEKEKGAVLSQADRIAENLKVYASTKEKWDLHPDWMNQAFRRFQENFDEKYKGFGGAPKFPRPVVFSFLVRYFQKTGEKKALEMTKETLQAMARGGIWDHVGFGFHRYSTDAAWRVPHFEKMLYDNAQLVVAYLETYRLTGEKGFAEVAENILTYLERDLSHPEGGFFSAEDADSPLPDHPERKGEGAFYLWSAEEIQRLFGKDAPWLQEFYGIRKEGNALFDPHGEFRNKNILHQALSIAEASRRFHIPREEMEKRLEEARRKLFEAREERERPLRDDKILCAWNGLALSALAAAYQVLGKEKYLERAQKCAVFLQKNLYDQKEKKLYRRWREGERKEDGVLEDYAFLIQGLLDLYESDFQEQWLVFAEELAQGMIARFNDPQDGGFFHSAVRPDVILRLKDTYDGAEPSGNAVAALDLLRLSALWDRKAWREIAEKTLQAAARTLEDNPTAAPQMLAALNFFFSKPLQIFFVGDTASPGAGVLKNELHRFFLPVKAAAWVDPQKNKEIWEKWLPFTRSLTVLKEKPTAYVCRDYTCELPTDDPVVFRKQLEKAVFEKP